MKRNGRIARRFVFAAALGAAAVGYFIDGLAQSGKADPGDEEELRAVYATAADISDGKAVAATACARCHGANGVSATKGIPHLAGQRAAFLHHELRTYRQSSRVQTAMDSVVRFLSDDALFKVAAYYASLDPPPAAAGAAKPAPKQDPLQAGKAATAACAGCHGDTGVSSTPGMPSLVGLDPKYFAAVMGAYKSGARKNDLMKPMAAALSDADLSNVALYYALQKPNRAQTPAPGDKAAGKKASATCAACHGDQGVSGNPVTPSLAGQDAQYLEQALRAYKQGARKDDSMNGPAAALDDKAIRNLAAYYASLQPQAPNVRRPLTLAEWTERCDRCHGTNGNSTDPRVPRLAAQREDWLETVLRAYQTGARKSTAMAAMSAVMTEADVKTLATYYARQTARSISYIVLPPRKAK